MFNKSKPHRRDFIRMGSIAGLGMADIMRMQHLYGSEDSSRSDINCIFLFIVGGMPHQDLSLIHI